MMNLGAVYRHQKLYDKAEPLLAGCLSKKRSSLRDSDSHSDTLHSLLNLAGLYDMQGLYE